MQSIQALSGNVRAILILPQAHTLIICSVIDISDNMYYAYLA